MDRSPALLRSIAGPVAALAALPTLAAVVLALAGEIAWIWAIAIAMAAVVGIAPIVFRHQRGMGRIADYANVAAARGEATGQQASTLAEVATAVGRLARGAADQRRQAESESRANAVIIENLPDPLLLVSDSGVILDANLAARTTFGSRLVGAGLSSVSRAPAILDAMADVLAGAAKREVEFEQPVPLNRTFNAIIEHLPVDDRAERWHPRASRAEAMILIHDLTALKRTEQLRAEFVANVSHELRTPLSALIGFVETLATSARDDPAARKRFLSLMDEQGRRMTRLIDDLLSLSKIEMDEHTQPSDVIDICAIAKAVAQALDQRARTRGISLELDLPDRRCPIIGDADQVYEVIENLIENAIRYSRDHTAVRMRIWRAGTGAGSGEGTFGLAVIDQGEGIAREHLPRITERFYRADKARSRAVGGTGLGLAIVKHIVSRHRAALQIESKVGEGSVFTVYWPSAGPSTEAADDTETTE